MKKQARKIMFEKLGAYLKQKRVSHNLSLGQVGDQTGVKGQFICNIERGMAMPPPRLLNQMIKLYELDGEQVLSFITRIHKEYFREIYLD